MSRPSSLLLFFLSIVVSATATAFPGCEPVSCGGNGSVNITYPFRAIDGIIGLASYCSRDDLEMFCLDGFPALTISSKNYTVLDINSNTRTITVVESTIRKSQCPKSLSNLNDLSYPVTHFRVASTNINLTFSSACSSSSSPDASFIRCLNSSVYLGDKNKSIEGVNGSSVGCNTSMFPVMNKSIDWTKELGVQFDGLMKKGFQLEWYPPLGKDCRVCESYHGRCGSQYTEKGFIFACYCSDEVMADYCGGRRLSVKVVDTVDIIAHQIASCLCDDKVHQFTYQKEKLNMPLKVVIGICSSLGGFFLAFICFYYWYKHKHTKRTSSLTKSLRNSSSKHESMEYDLHSLSSPCHSTHIFSYNELQVATDGFASYNELGDGGFGTVYKGKLKDGRTVAIKRLYENSYKRVEQFNNEVSILNRLRHHNLVTLYGSTSHQSRELLLVYEYISNGTVADHLHGVRADEGALTWSVRMNIAIETAQALSYLHAVEPPIIHRDIKTNNILLDKNFHVKVADFGLSRLFPPDLTHVSTVPQGTAGYVDPEYYQCYKLTDKSDVYSFGVVLVELISSKPAVDVNRLRHEINLSNMAINKIQNSLLHELVDLRLGFDSDWKVRKMIESVAEVAFRCLQSEKEMRPTIKEVLEQLEHIVNRNYDDEKSADIQINDDTSLLKDPVQFLPSSVAVPWASRSTTPNTSE